MKPTIVTAALPYANGPVHIGHLAGAYLPSDIYVRFLRMMNEDVVFICGSDEHGVPITLRARKEGITPQQVVDKYHSIIKKSFADIGISFDIYHRTSEKIHYETAADFFKVIYDKGIFTVAESEQYYDEEANTFLADRYITGTCPNCGNTNAYGDQCEKCGKSLSPDDLINPHSQLSGKPPIKRKTKHWYLPLDKIQGEWLDTWIRSHEGDWKNNVFGQCKSWLDQGLQPRAVTRDLDWGVPVPLPEAKGKVLYVWFDAPIGYISATKALFVERNDPEGWKKYWQNKDARLLHFIGKDNIVFHCIIFPAMLKAHGDFILPENVPSNEFLNLEGDKISTSRNWAVWLHEYLEEFPNKQDVLRYVLCATAPENKDNDFTWKDFQARNNNELVAILGNFINRTLVLTQKYYEGKTPSMHELNAEDKLCIQAMKAIPSKIKENILGYRFRDALFELMNLARTGNKYLADNEPWKIQATDPKRVETILAVSLEIAAALANCMQPFLPFSSEKLLKMLNLKASKWDDFHGKMLFKPGHQLGEASLLFDKIEDEAIEFQINKLNASKAANVAAAPVAQAHAAKPSTSFDDFSKMDIRVGTILTAERVPKTDKLMKLTIDTGIDQRTVVSGIAEHYKPENIIGQQVTILVNLEPRKIKGIESQGMILMAENANGELAFVSPVKSMENGAGVK
ncbi:MAG: methionine--tRNA ligase [Bacteroidetes bacterium]|nr:methionine--tRNA ligase [Bacteroidota bacterium]